MKGEKNNVDINLESILSTLYINTKTQHIFILRPYEFCLYTRNSMIELFGDCKGGTS